MDVNAILSHARKVRKQGSKVKDHLELKIDKPSVKTLSCDFLKRRRPIQTVLVLTPISKTLKKARVTERSCEVTPRSKYRKMDPLERHRLCITLASSRLMPSAIPPNIQGYVKFI